MAYTSIQSAIQGLLGSAFSFVRGFGVQPSGDFHHGVDIAAAQGTIVPALESGTVVFSGFAGGGGTGYVHPYAPPTNPIAANQYAATGGGNVVVIKDASGLEHIYAHLNTIDLGVGQAVSAGTPIGTVGDTGDATGFHLHYGIFNPTTGQFADPTPYLENIPTGDTNSLTAFQAALAKLGINNDPNYTFNHADATKLADQYGFTSGSQLYNDAVAFFEGKTVSQVAGSTNNLFGSANITPDSVAGALTGLSNALTGVGLFIGIVFVGIMLLLVAALVSRNSAQT